MSTLVYFCVVPVSEITYIGLLVGELPLQLLHLLVFLIEDYDTFILLLLIKLLFMLVDVSDPNLHDPDGMPRMPPLILFRDFDFIMCPL